MTGSPSRDDAATMTCPVCQHPFTPPAGSDTAATGAARPRSGAATKDPPAAVTVPAARPRREHTVYECPDCGERLLGQQRCPDCATFARRVGPGGPMPRTARSQSPSPT